jgi:hypothetical protein
MGGPERGFAQKARPAHKVGSLPKNSLARYSSVCVSCLAVEIGIPLARADEAIRHVRAYVEMKEQSARCTRCGQQAQVFALT